MSDESGAAVLAHGVAAYREVLRERLVAAYALGSLAHGGFAPEVSDVDLALILDGRSPADRPTIERVRDEVHARGGLYGRLSVFWSSAVALADNRGDGRFPAIDRLDLAEHGKLLYGKDIAADLPRPGAAELIGDSARSALEFFATDQVVDTFRDPHRLVGDRLWLTKIVLLPVRFLHTARTGRVEATDKAAERYLTAARPVAGELVGAAMRWRNGEAFDEDDAVLLLRAHLVPLYTHYTDSLLAESLSLAGDSGLVAGFEEWRARLRQ
ncbi:hypothetical protein [Nocardia crassostreae]|uniref:hypothetical protein n=1 Tax=Nocardia crassostreae TaxID=53428 RepID=UPI00082CF394|nr:hypothetical protein [Nocardia crassostreae]